MFQFIFEGNLEQFTFFKKVVKERIDNSGLELQKQVGNEWHCSIIDDMDNVFKMGMLISACYYSFYPSEDLLLV